MKKLLLLVCTLLISSTILAQINLDQIIPDFASPSNFSTPQEHKTVCLTDQTNSPNLAYLENIRGLDHTNDIFYVKIYIHTLSKEQEPYYGFTTEAVNRILQKLYDDFDPLGIHFVWDGEIDNIQDDYLAFPSPWGTNIGDIFNTNNHQDGIDIYLADELLSGSNWYLSNGIANYTEMLIAGYSMAWEVIPMSWLNYISHTMGHILFLYDTQWGTSIYEPYNCPEKADGSNGSTCGDYIFDTPADPGLYYFNVDVSDCSFDPQYYDIPAVDPLTGLNYTPDTGNLMSLTNPSCYDDFSYGQKKRMKNAIWYIPVLNQTLEITTYI